MSTFEEQQRASSVKQDEENSGGKEDKQTDRQSSEGHSEQEGLEEDDNDDDENIDEGDDSEETENEKGKKQTSKNKQKKQKQKKKKKKPSPLMSLSPLGLWDNQTGGDSSDEDELKDTREPVHVDVETAKEAISIIRAVQADTQKLESVRVHCIKHRIQARRELVKAKQEYEDSLKEYRRIICDPYDSQLHSLVHRAERDLDRKENILKNQERTTEHFNFGDASAHLLAKALKRADTLCKLELAKNDIGHLGIKSLAISLTKCKALTHLDLHENPIGRDGAEYLGKILKKCKALAVINLNSCGLQDSLVRLAPHIGLSKQLRKLSLRNNACGQDGLSALCEHVISKNTPLLELDLSTNNIGVGSALVALVEALEVNKRLQRLDLSHNNLLHTLRRPGNRDIHLALRRERITGVWPPPPKIDSHEDDE